MNLFKNLFDYETKELKKINKLADQVDALDEEMQKIKDIEFKAKTEEFKKRIQNGETLDDILVEAVALAREACFRAIGEKPFRVQVIGGIAIHRGNIAEMKTGEGKTLTTVLPAYLNSLTGKGVHVVTTNEYLSTRNAEWMKPIYDLLGVTVGINTRDKNPQEKREAYNADITYTTNNELGFDYLRDNMVVHKENRTQRGLNFAIIDEVDSILIDEARTPLIISGGRMQSKNLYASSDTFVKTLTKEKDYTIDAKTKSVSLTEAGSDKACSFFKLNNLYDIENSALVHHIDQALKANYGMTIDVDYVVQNDEVVIVDQFTGRLMKGREFSDGLHQAIEAKEVVTIQEETRTLATITFQNLFRMYNKLSGMTGTAKTEEEEFRNIYNMYVIEIPTNKEVIREDLTDLVYATKQAKFNAIVNEIERRHKLGQPILVGTIAIETSELVSRLLTRKGIKHEVLNAKNHAREAEIIANAGEKGSVTIATNMAGRGTDIKLGEGVKELGGLAVLGSERNDSRRVDNQLRGRSGRQGDVGESRFYISLEDNLMKLFGSDRIQTMAAMLNMPEDMPLEMKMLTSTIENAQKNVEAIHFANRKRILQYDDIMNEQRHIIYTERRQVLDGQNMRDKVISMIRKCVDATIDSYYGQEHVVSDKGAFENYVRQTFDVEFVAKDEKPDTLKEELYNLVLNRYEEKEKEIGDDHIRELERVVILRNVDTKWMDHIDCMEQLKEGIQLRGYGQTDPVVAFRYESYEVFNEMTDSIAESVVKTMLHLVPQEKVDRVQIVRNMMTNLNQAQKAGTEKAKPKTNAPGQKVGRNEPCPCGSGKKYKHCCGK